ncbi:ArsR/SmtB family transcription factor [Halobacterium litoreum]|uniref:ArsR/SmtB family transcription factor n=1 Tax=Halobacterium litoreum TaxID=2039234 RepID=A0ABD5NHH4_9EURY|nr:helix-turn-helix domain-containing protein [Halobacterium litoreum]UHH12460.1 helix-turn-helix domain-containing protein [Halobacterium litoreum]
MPANRLIPGRSTAERGDGSNVVGIREEAADEVFEALSSRTAREILAALYEEPDTASSVADTVDTSLQNASYHIEKLVDAGLVEVADTWYSEQGREMKVYAPASESLVVFASDEASKPSLKDRLLRILGAFGVLGIASVVVQRLFGQSGAGGGDDSQYAISGGDAADETVTTAESQVGVMGQEQVETTATVADAAAQGIPPGLVFFAGGLLVLTLALTYVWYRDR